MVSRLGRLVTVHHCGLRHFINKEFIINTTPNTQNTPTITSRPNVGVTARVFQQQAFAFKRLFIQQPVLIVVEQGVKVLRCAHAEFTLQAGDAVAVAGGQTVDMSDQLSADGSYAARWLIDEHAHSLPNAPVIEQAHVMIQPANEFQMAFENALSAIERADLPEAIARYRASELLLWIAMNGGRFAPRQALGWSEKIRQLVRQDLSHNWSASVIAAALSVSESTLRRRLAEQGTNLNELLTDIRMGAALILLQSSKQSVTQLALSVGYQTASHFSSNFRKRFGYSPSELRGAHRLKDNRSQCNSGSTE